MLLAPLVAVKTISWFVVGGYAAAGAGLSAAAIYLTNSLFSASRASNEVLQHLETTRENLTNTRLENLATENQTLNIEVQDATATNSAIHENLIITSTQAKEAAAQTKMASRELQAATNTLASLSKHLDAKAQKIVVSLKQHLIRINQDLQVANEANKTAALLESELQRLQNISRELEARLLELRSEKSIESKKLTEEKLALAKAVQQTNEQTLFLIAENKALKTENQNLRALKQANGPVTQTGSQSNLQFFSRQ